jgi:hypothetical protein
MIELVAAIFIAVKLVELSLLGTFIASIVGALILVIKLPGDRGTVRITREQGATQIRDAFISALQRDLERKNTEIDRCARTIEQLELRVDQLEAANTDLTRQLASREPPA